MAAARDRVGMFIVTIRSTELPDAPWFARIASTLDVAQDRPHAVLDLSPTVAIDELVSCLAQWVAQFETLGRQVR